jgi:hypothetical protein
MAKQSECYEIFRTPYAERAAQSAVLLAISGIVLLIPYLSTVGAGVKPPLWAILGATIFVILAASRWLFPLPRPVLIFRASVNGLTVIKQLPRRQEVPTYHSIGWDKCGKSELVPWPSGPDGVEYVFLIDMLIPKSDCQATSDIGETVIRHRVPISSRKAREAIRFINEFRAGCFHRTGHA